MNPAQSVRTWMVLALWPLFTACQSLAGQSADAAPPDPPSGLATQTPASPGDTMAWFDATLAGTPQPTPASLVFLEAEPLPESDWRPPPYPSPLALRYEDHFYLSRPLPSDEDWWPNAEYGYGSTHFGDEKVHTGIDLVADRGTPVVAAGDGEVVWVGYGLYRGAEDLADPYGLAVAVRHDFGYHGETIHTIYGHLSAAIVWPGQRVKAGEVLGAVGDTGNASGTHLHFEVRMGESRYFNTRNPELWIVPADGTGVLAGLILDRWGRPLPEQLIQIRSLDTGERYRTWTYAPGTVRADDLYGENFVIGNLPAGAYEIRIDISGRASLGALNLYPGQTNFFSFRHKVGFVIEPTPEGSDASAPPWP